MAGSSPRVRGAGPSCYLVRGFSGIIPARAGSRFGFSGASSIARDHPRACGEQRLPTMAAGINTGSSPRVRGAEWNGLNVTVTFGIIPARAGSSCRMATTRAAARDHPRACGEQPLTYQRPALPLGSSPHVRGAVAQLEVVEHRLGIIPACAGSSRSARHRCGGRRDHPRACGEQLRDIWMRYGGGESSPRVRGAAFLVGAFRIHLGIIPARAGSSRKHPLGSRPCRDHPRACGEQRLPFWAPSRPAGSSPRVRGAAPDAGHAVHAVGIIPARAGSSSGRNTARHRRRDHPRACGEQLVCCRTVTKGEGSSPRVRGAE